MRICPPRGAEDLVISAGGGLATLRAATDVDVDL